MVEPKSVSISEILHSGFTIFRRDRPVRGGGGVLIAIKTASFKAVKEFKPESEAELQQLEIIFAEITTPTGQRIYSVFAMGHPMKAQAGRMYSITFCMKFVTIDSASGANELAFIETLHDHLLTCTTQ